MLIRSNACVIMFLSNYSALSSKPCMFELIAVKVLQIFEKLDSRSLCQVLEQKDWKLSLEIKSNEYISVFPLIFQFSHNVLCTYKALIKSTCNSGLHRIFKHSLIFFFSSLQLITDLIENLEAQLFSFFQAYNLSLIFCQLSEYLCFYRMKAGKISCRKVKISISPRSKNVQFSAPGERYVYLKKNSARVKISPQGEFHLAYV